MTGAAEGDELTELLGFKKSPSLNLGSAVGFAAGVAVASVFTFLRARLASGDSVGDSAVTAEAAVSVGGLVASAVFCWRCFFGGEGDSEGNSAGTAV
jgi:hypothetical protein